MVRWSDEDDSRQPYSGILKELTVDGPIFAAIVCVSVGECYLTPTQHFLAISWREQVNFQ